MMMIRNVNIYEDGTRGNVRRRRLRFIVARFSELAAAPSLGAIRENDIRFFPLYVFCDERA